MVAIDLTKLEQQIGQLREFYAEPERFSKALDAMLSFYQRYSYRPHRRAMPTTFLRSYNLPQQVLPQIEIGLRKTAQAHPEETLDLAQTLWQDPYYEPRALAASLLGQLPAQYSDKLCALLRVWLAQPIDRGAIDSLFTKAIPPLQQTKQWKLFVLELLNSPEDRLRNYGLAALAHTLNQFPLEELPELLNEIKPLIETADDKLAANLAKVVNNLARRSPQETVYILKLILVETPGSTIERRIRSYASFFPEESAQSLVEALKKHTRLRELEAQAPPSSQEATSSNEQE
jgi:hypothetical protein